jgi:hypothetical protein
MVIRDREGSGFDFVYPIYIQELKIIMSYPFLLTGADDPVEGQHPHRISEVHLNPRT